jgi:hypothetical protein
MNTGSAPRRRRPCISPRDPSLPDIANVSLSS